MAGPEPASVASKPLLNRRPGRTSRKGAGALGSGSEHATQIISTAELIRAARGVQSDVGRKPRQTSTLRESTSQPPSSLSKAARKFAFFILGLYALAAVAIAADHFVQAGRIYPAVTVLRVPVGGMDPLEAVRRLTESTDGGGLARYRFVIDGKIPAYEGQESEDFVWRGRELGVDFDILESAHRAYAVGREGSLSVQVKDRVNSRLAGASGTGGPDTGGFAGAPVSVEPAVSYRSQPALAAVEKMARALYEPPTNAAVRIRHDGSANEALEVPKVEVLSAEPGFQVDERGTLGRLKEALGRLESEVELSTYEPYPDIPTAAAEEAAQIVRTVLTGDPVVIEGPDRDYNLYLGVQAGWLQVEPVPDHADISVSLDDAVLQEALAPIADDVARPPENASLYVDSSSDDGPQEASTVRVSPGKPGSRAARRGPAEKHNPRPIGRP